MREIFKWPFKTCTCNVKKRWRPNIKIREVVRVVVQVQDHRRLNWHLTFGSRCKRATRPGRRIIQRPCKIPWEAPNHSRCAVPSFRHRLCTPSHWCSLQHPLYIQKLCSVQLSRTRKMWIVAPILINKLTNLLLLKRNMDKTPWW